MGSEGQLEGGLRRELMAGGALVLGVGVLGYLVFSGLNYDWNWGAMWKYRVLFLQGLGMTVGVSVGALVGSVLLGVGLMAGVRSSVRTVRWVCRGYVQLVRGTPLLVQLLIGYYLVADAVGFDHPLGVAVVLLAFYGAAYVAEILRGGVESVSKSQIEAGRAVGFDEGQVFRFVVLPQAVRRVLPALTGQLVLLIKDSSLLSVIGIKELTQQVKIANSATYSSLEGYVPLAVGYLLLTIPLMALADWMERRVRYED